MKALKLVSEPVDINIKEATLLSEEEYARAQNVIPHIYDWWWLRSPGIFRNDAVYVDTDGSLYESSVSGTNIVVRPALKTSNLEILCLKTGDSVEIAGVVWIKIAEDILLCSTSVGCTCFRKDWEAPDANDYEASDIKKWLEKWVKETGLINT